MTSCISAPRNSCGIRSLPGCARTKAPDLWLRSTSEKPDRVLAPTLPNSQRVPGKKKTGYHAV